MDRLHVPVFLLSLVLALAIKVAVHEGEQVTEQLFEARASYPQLDPGRPVKVLDPRSSVDVRLRGRSSEMANLNPFAVVEIPPGTRGPYEVKLEPADIRGQGDIEVVSIEPNRFTVEVEPLIRRMVPLVVEITGEPAAGAEVGPATVDPNRVELEGPESMVLELDAVSLEVSIDRRAMSFQEQVQVIAPDPLIQILEPNRVVVTIPMAQPELRPLRPEQSEEQAEGGPATRATGGDG